MSDFSPVGYLIGVMADKSDAQLLRDYALHGVESAFAALVARHANIVFSAAARQADSPDSAADVSQRAFIALAQSAVKLAARMPADASLAGWLCRTARNISCQTRRYKFRQETRALQAMELLPSFSEPAPDWDQLRPVLDEVMSQLSEADYDAIVLRFYNNQDFRAVGRALGVSEDAAQKRVARALEKLRAHFLRRGVAASSVALSAALSAHAVQLAPVGWAVAVSTAALAQMPAAAASTAKAIAMTTIQKILAAAIIVVTAAGIYETSRTLRLHSQLQITRDLAGPLAARIGKLQSERDDALSQLAAVRADRAREQSNLGELLRLRGKFAPLLAASNELAFIKAAETNEVMQNAVRDRIARARDLAEHVVKLPGSHIPEFIYLNTKDWLDAAKDYVPGDEDSVSDAIGPLQRSARYNFAWFLQNALENYLNSHNGQLPAAVADLKSYFPVTPVIDEALQSYKMLETGNVANLPDSAFLISGQPGGPSSDRLKIMRGGVDSVPPGY
jgi:RNA polymerase sigma factor (sigma-70 family)